MSKQGGGEVSQLGLKLVTIEETERLGVQLSLRCHTAEEIPEAAVRCGQTLAVDMNCPSIDKAGEHYRRGSWRKMSGLL